MAFITINHHVPADNGAAFVAENATLAGSVRLEKNSSVWYGAVLRADTGHIAIGENSNVQDNAVLHTGPGLDVTVGRGTSVGHGAVVHGCTVGDGCLIGMHATILNGAVIGDGARLEYVVADRDATIRDTRTLVGYKTYPLFIEKKSVI